VPWLFLLLLACPCGCQVCDPEILIIILCRVNPEVLDLFGNSFNIPADVSPAEFENAAWQRLMEAAGFPDLATVPHEVWNDILRLEV